MTQPFFFALYNFLGSSQHGILERLELTLKETVRYMKGKSLKESDPGERSKILRGGKSGICSNDDLFRRAQGNFRVIPMIPEL